MIGNENTHYMLSQTGDKPGNTHTAASYSLIASLLSSPGTPTPLELSTTPVELTAFFNTHRGAHHLNTANQELQSKPHMFAPHPNEAKVMVNMTRIWREKPAPPLIA